MSDQGTKTKRCQTNTLRVGFPKVWRSNSTTNHAVNNRPNPHLPDQGLSTGHGSRGGQGSSNSGRKRNCFSHKKQEKKDSGISDLKEIGLWYGGSLVMNAIVGLGIFGTPKGVLLEVGSVGMTLLIWTFTGIFSMFAALCFVELRESVRKEGVEYAYITEAFGPLAGFVYTWMRIAAAEPAATALFSMVFTNYLTDSIYDGCGPPETLVVMLSILAILSMCLVNVLSTNLSERLQHLATVGKTCALVTIVVIGIQRLGNGNLEIINQGMTGTKLSQSNLVFACYNGLWAYGGWSQVNHVTSGIKKPPRNVPRVVKTVIPIVLMLYLTVVLSYFTAMTQDDLLSSRAIGVTWAERVLGPAKPIVTIGVCLTALGSLNATFLSAGRLSGVAAKNGQMPDVASWVHVRSKTPLLVVTLKAVVAMVVVSLATIQECLRFYIFCVWLFHGMSVLALLVLRYKNKHKLRPYKVDLWIPVVVVVVIVYLLLIPFTQTPGPEFIAVVILIFLSLVTYYPMEWIKTHSKIHFPDTLTIWLQLILRVAPKRELRREKRRSIIRRYLALDSILHPENDNKARPVTINQFASLRYPRNRYNTSRGQGSGWKGQERNPNLLCRRFGSSLRATDLKLLTSNYWQSGSNIISDRLKPPIANIPRRRRESHSFSGADVTTSPFFPSRPSLPILKNRFNTTPTATKDSEPGALASPSAMMYSREVPPSFVNLNHRHKTQKNGNVSLGSPPNSETSSSLSSHSNSMISSDASPQTSVVLRPQALPRYHLQKFANDVLHPDDNKNKKSFAHNYDRHVFFSNDDYSSSSDEEDDKTDDESFENLEHTILTSLFGLDSSSETSTDDEEDEEEEDMGEGRLPKFNKNKKGDEYSHTYSNMYPRDKGYDASNPSIYTAQEHYDPNNNNNTSKNNIRRNETRHCDAIENSSSLVMPTPRQRLSLLQDERPHPTMRRFDSVEETSPISLSSSQPVPRPRHRTHRQKRQLPLDYEHLDVSFV